MLNDLLALNQLVWNEKFWLPNNYSWSELNKHDALNFDNLISIPMIVAVLLYIIRIIFER
jgi:hypothetical protein